MIWYYFNDYLLYFDLMSFTLVGCLSLQKKWLHQNCVSSPESIVQPVLFWQKQADFFFFYCTDLSIEVQQHQAEMRIGRNRWNCWEQSWRRPERRGVLQTDRRDGKSMRECAAAEMERATAQSRKDGSSRLSVLFVTVLLLIGSWLPVSSVVDCSF